MEFKEEREHGEETKEKTVTQRGGSKWKKNRSNAEREIAFRLNINRILTFPILNKACPKINSKRIG